MISLSWKRIVNQKYKSFMTLIAMIIIIFLTSFGIQSSQKTKLVVAENLEDYSRGSYDLLVRPKDARTNIERTLQTVEENYIGDGAGGISISEWESIKEHLDIEIAAPVASLGYFTGNTASISLPTLDYPYKFKYRFFTSDGLTEYPVTSSYTTYYLQFINNKHLYAIDTYSDPSQAPRMFDGGLYVSFPQNYYLLTAIDAESERMLTGIDFSELFRAFSDEEGRLIESFSENRGNAPIVPILQRENSQIPLSFQVTVEKLNLSLNELYAKYGLSKEDSFTSQLQFLDDSKIKEFENDLLSMESSSQETYHLDLTNYQSPFDGQHLALDQHFNIDLSSQEDGGTLYNDSGKYYTASKIDYKIKDDLLQVDIVKEGSPPDYKEVTEVGKSYLGDWEAPFMIWKMGTFSAEEDNNTLASSPLGIYSTKEVRTSDGTVLTPTIAPGSFIAAPAAGITTLEAASLIKGNQPIDAIRIKLNHITAYDYQAQQRIEELATELSNKGYVVDIVAGSSFMNRQMMIEGVGEVTSPWTTLGVSQFLSNAWNTDIMLSVVLFTLFSLLWFMNHLEFERNRLARENEILTLLGWSKSSVRIKNIVEQLIYLLIATLISVALAFALDFESSAYVVMGGFLFVGFLLIVIVFYINPSQKNRSKMYRIFPSIRYYKSLLIPTMLVLLLAICITQLQLSSIHDLWIKSSETTLGTYLLNEGLYIRLIIVFATAFLSISVFVEAIKGLILARQDEFQMYHVIGWTRKMIKIHFLKEVLIWAILSLGIGVSLGIIVSIILAISLEGILLGLMVSSITYLITVLITVSFREYRSSEE